MTFKISTNELEQLRGKIKDRWSKLTHDDLDKIDDMRDDLVDRVQEKYGHVRKKAEAEVDQWLDTYSHKKQEVAQNLSDKTDQVKQRIDLNLERYNSRLADAAEKLPGDINQTVDHYPWLAMMAALCVGFIMGLWLKPCWRPMKKET